MIMAFLRCENIFDSYNNPGAWELFLSSADEKSDWI